MVSELLMARQPILDRGGKVYAYELLYRTAGARVAGPLDLAAEHESILNTMVEIGLGRLSGDKLAFFNLSPGMLKSACTQLLPPDRVVLELLENTKLDEPTVRRMAELRAQGYRLAYDDFTFAAHQLAFVGRVDLIKIDVMDTPWPMIVANLPKMKSLGTCLLAEKVEDRETYEKCRAAGFDLFQGYYFARPETMSVTAVDARKRAVLNLLKELNRPTATSAQLESALAVDATLAVRLLKLVNNAGFGTGRKVDSVRTAIDLLGLDRLRAFATVLAASGMTSGDSRVVSDLGLIRARMCEKIAQQLGEGDAHKRFTIGLLSVLDALLNLPMNQIVCELSLSDDVAAALLRPSECRPLWLTLAYERGAWGTIRQHNLNGKDLAATYADAAAGAAAFA